MMKRLFFGGVHPKDGKSLSAEDSMTITVTPKQVVILLSQHIGPACTPLVKQGDYVRKGQKIGDGIGLCVPVHASVSGEVIGIELRRQPDGQKVMAVVIENDFKDTIDQAMSSHNDYTKLSREEIISIIREAGIVGMGGAMFSTNVKVDTSLDQTDVLIANACECEPYITADDTLLRTSPEQVLEGMQIIRQVLKPQRTVLAIEDNKKEAIASLQKLLTEQSEIELCVLPTRYPQGAEKQLIQAVTGREVPPGQLPAAVRCAVFNAATYAAIYKAVCLGQPVTERIVTVTGESVKRPGNFIVRIGTSFAELIEAAGGLKENVWKVINGGPMMGAAQPDLSASVTKGTNAILCLSQKENREAAHPTCIRCGKCITVCPMKLQPLYLYCYANRKDEAALEQYHLKDCIGCGCCSYVCPGKLPLTERFREAKQYGKEAKK